MIILEGSGMKISQHVLGQIIEMLRAYKKTPDNFGNIIADLDLDGNDNVSTYAGQQIMDCTTAKITDTIISEICGMGFTSTEQENIMEQFNRER